MHSQRPCSCTLHQPTQWWNPCGARALALPGFHEGSPRNRAQAEDCMGKRARSQIQTWPGGNGTSYARDAARNHCTESTCGFQQPRVLVSGWSFCECSEQSCVVTTFAARVYVARFLVTAADSEYLPHSIVSLNSCGTLLSSSGSTCGRTVDRSDT